MCNPEDVCECRKDDHKDCAMPGTYVHTYKNAYVYVCVYMYTCVCVCIYAYPEDVCGCRKDDHKDCAMPVEGGCSVDESLLNLCMCVCMYVCVYVCMYVSMDKVVGFMRAC